VVVVLGGGGGWGLGGSVAAGEGGIKSVRVPVMFVQPNKNKNSAPALCDAAFFFRQ